MAGTGNGFPLFLSLANIDLVIRPEMKRSTLAARLIREGNYSRRKKLLAENLALADAYLARELKDYCYRVWTSEPSNTRMAAAALETLAEFSPDKETRAMASWVKGIAEITGGKLESAVASLDKASRLLRRLGNEHESAQPLVAKLIALAMLGKYKAAQSTGEKALKIFTKHKDQLAAGKIEMNLSNIVSRRDQYRLAETYCRSAHRRFTKLGERTWQTMAENGLANTYAELNDFKRADEFYARALTNARRAKMHVTVAEIEASMGNLELFRGRYGEAIRMLELSRQKYEKLGMPHQTAVAELEIADIYAELNLSTEAAEIYRRLIPTLHRLKMRAEEARARANFGRTLIASENFSTARNELRRAAKLFERERNATASASAQLRLASLEVTLRNYVGALSVLDASAPLLDKTENVRLRLSADWLRGEILAKMARFADAEKLITRTFKESRKLEQPAVAQAAMNSLGVIARELGRFEKAETMFELAIDAAESARAPLPGEEFRMAFLAKSLEPYENLVQLQLAQGNFEKAFIAVERARSRSLLDAVGTGKTNRKNDGSTKLRDELNRAYSRLGRAANDAEAVKLQRQIRDREKRLATLSLRTQSSTRSRTQKIVRGLDVHVLQKQLGGQKALIEFVEHAGRYSAFVITDRRVDHVSDVASEGDILSLLEGLHFQFGALRFGPASVAAFSQQLKSRADSYLQKLYDALLRRIVPDLGEREAVIVPAGALNYVPFHALFDGEKYLIESRDISYAPSAAVWMKLASKIPRPPKNALLMAFADERIPLVDREVEQLSRLLSNATTLKGKSASFAAFQERAADFDLIHLACHGQFRSDNPMFSSLHLADGWITVRDICSSGLKAGLVTLSACETGLNKIFAGEEILGLARGFLSSGARSLVLSLWTVNDSATAGLMADLYDNLQRGKTIAASLRVAQVKLIKKGEHPYFWSPFLAIG
jgi:tetratricopeptide (TPR) repeat protein